MTDIGLGNSVAKTIFKCRICNKAYATEDDLIVHIKIEHQEEIIQMKPNQATGKIQE